MLFTFCGISGCGKSTRAKECANAYGDAITISPDDLRKAITGDISNQSANREVFAASYYMVEKLLAAEIDVIFDATNLDERSFKKLLEIARKTDTKVRVEIFIDSLDVELCRSRIKSDLVDNVDRSKTSEGDILERQNVKFLHMLDYFETLRDPIVEGIARI